jgi:hypothetical protein
MPISVADVGRVEQTRARNLRDDSDRELTIASVVNGPRRIAATSDGHQQQCGTSE